MSLVFYMFLDLVRSEELFSFRTGARVLAAIYSAMIEFCGIIRILMQRLQRQNALYGQALQGPPQLSYPAKPPQLAYPPTQHSRADPQRLQRLNALRQHKVQHLQRLNALEPRP